jgi:hypothetical protein
MTAELKQYIDTLNVQVYRMIDGSVLLAEEQHRDQIERYVILNRPLQICQIVMANQQIKTMYVPWIPGNQEHIRVNLDSVLAEADANFEQKFTYSRFFLINHLQKFLPPAEFAKILAEQKQATSTATMPSPTSSLKQALSKQKRFNLN